METKRTASALGRAAEDKAAEYLSRHGLTILARNYRVRGAEIDIIAGEGDAIVFVEVRSRASARYATPRESVTPAKQKRICQAALRWLQENDKFRANVRFDVIEMLAGGITHLCAAFDYIES